LRLRDFIKNDFGRLRQFLFDNFVAKVYTFITDVYTWSGYKFFDLLLRLSAEGAL
jgi:hypothetical protein